MQVRELFSYLPSNNQDDPPYMPPSTTRPPLPRVGGDRSDRPAQAL